MRQHLAVTLAIKNKNKNKKQNKKTNKIFLYNHVETIVFLELNLFLKHHLLLNKPTNFEKIWAFQGGGQIFNVLYGWPLGRRDEENDQLHLEARSPLAQWEGAIALAWPCQKSQR